MSDLVNKVETGAIGALDAVGKLGTQIEADIPGTVAKLIAAVHVMQSFALAAHGMLASFFPNNNLPHPTAEGLTDANAIAPAIVAAAPEEGQ